MDNTNGERWSPYAKDEFVQVLKKRHDWYWWLGGYGAQKEDGLNEAKVAPMVISPLVGGWLSRHQSWTDHYKRQLPWLGIHLYDLYSGAVTFKQLRFIKSLYDSAIDVRSKS